MTESYEDAWGTDSGLLDEYEGTITESWFSTDPQYNSGETMLLHWTIATNNPDVPETTEKFPCGGGWDSRDGGKTVVSEQGKTKFNRQSIVGRIVDRVVKNDGVLHDAFSVIGKRGVPTNAEIWKGLTFQFKREEFDYGGEIGKRERIMPVKFLGENAQVSTTSVAAAPAAEKAAVEIPAALKVQLLKAAKAAESHQSFLDEAMTIDEVVADDELLAYLIDDSPAGFYASQA